MSVFLETIRYGIVGILNTTVGLAIIILAMSVGMGDIPANITGYSFGFVISYVLNGKWTFRNSELTNVKLIRFSMVIGFAYGMNLLILILVRDALDWDRVLAQLSGVVTYTVVAFFGMKLIAFKTTPSPQQIKTSNGK